jgi:hypothetical protein
VVMLKKMKSTINVSSGASNRAFRLAHRMA